MIHLTMNLLLQAAAVTAGAHDYATAYRETNESGRPLVVLIGADWCPGCRTMKYTSLPELEKSGGLSKVTVAYVNVDEETPVGQQVDEGKLYSPIDRVPQDGNRLEADASHRRRAPSEIQSLLDRAVDASVDASVPKISSRP